VKKQEKWEEWGRKEGDKGREESRGEEGRRYKEKKEGARKEPDKELRLGVKNVGFLMKRKKNMSCKRKGGQEKDV